MAVKRYTTFAERTVASFMYTLISLFIIFCALPFWLVLAGSVTSEASIRLKGFQIIPGEISLEAYRFIFSGTQIFRSYGVTMFVTVTGTFLAVLVSSMFAYVLAHPKARYRNVLSFMAYFTMLFGSGLVGFYILISKWLNLKDNVWALILPYLFNPFFVFILVAFLRGLPYEINESATIDGANEIYIFFMIAWPMAIPSIATVTLFYALQYWNDWWLALLFINDSKYHPLQMMLRQVASQIKIDSYAGVSAVYKKTIPAFGVRYAVVCVVIGPIIFLYPFVQRYFIKGLTIGAIKG